MTGCNSDTLTQDNSGFKSMVNIKLKYGMLNRLLLTHATDLGFFLPGSLHVFSNFSFSLVILVLVTVLPFWVIICLYSSYTSTSSFCRWKKSLWGYTLGFGLYNAMNRLLPMYLLVTAGLTKTTKCCDPDAVFNLNHNCQWELGYNQLTSIST